MTQRQTCTHSAHIDLPCARASSPRVFKAPAYEFLNRRHTRAHHSLSSLPCPLPLSAGAVCPLRPRPPFFALPTPPFLPTRSASPHFSSILAISARTPLGSRHFPRCLDPCSCSSFPFVVVATRTPLLLCLAPFEFALPSSASQTVSHLFEPPRTPPLPRARCLTVLDSHLSLLSLSHAISAPRIPFSAQSIVPLGLQACLPLHASHSLGHPSFYTD